MSHLTLTDRVVAALLAVGCSDDRTLNARTVPGESAAATDGSPLAAVDGASELLFVLKGDAELQNGRLEINNSGDVTWFTDRPQRSAGTVAPAALMQAWAGLGFTDDPPNAVLATTDRSVPVELADPSWTDATSALPFAITPLGRRPLPLGELDQVELFIDDGVTCTTDPYIMTISNPPDGLAFDDCWSAVETAVEALSQGADAAAWKHPLPAGLDLPGPYVSPDYEAELFGFQWRCNLFEATYSCEGLPPAPARPTSSSPPENPLSPGGGPARA